MFHLAGKSFHKSIDPLFPTPDYCLILDATSSWSYVVSRYIFPHGTTNATLKSKTMTLFQDFQCIHIFHFAAGWDAGEWAYVCARLGIFDNHTDRVLVKFCNHIDGCNFSNCPHTEEDDQLPLFQLPEVEKNSTLNLKNGTPPSAVHFNSSSIQNLSNLLLFNFICAVHILSY
jgi:hypothetical protein